MTDERLAEIGDLIPRMYPSTSRDELHRALIAERGRVVRLEAALTDLTNAVNDTGLADDLPWEWESNIFAASDRGVAVLAEGDAT